MCAPKKLIGVCLIGLAVASPIVVPSAAAPQETDDGITEWPRFNPVDITPQIIPKPTSQPRDADSVFNHCGFPPLQPCWFPEDELRHRLDEVGRNLLPPKVTDEHKKPLVRPEGQVPHIIPPKIPHPPAGHHEDGKEDGSDPKAPGVKRDVAGAEAASLHDSEDHDGPVPTGPVTTPAGVAVARVTVTATVGTTTTVPTEESAVPVPAGPVTASTRVTVTASTRVTVTVSAPVTVTSTVPTTVSKWVPVIPVTTSTRVPVLPWTPVNIATSTGVNITTWTAVPTAITTTVPTTITVSVPTAISKWVPTTYSTWFPTASGTVSTLVEEASEWPGTYTNPHPKTTPPEVPKPSYKNKSSHTPTPVTKPTHRVNEPAHFSLPQNPEPVVAPGPKHAAQKDKEHDQHIDSDDSVQVWPLPSLQARDLQRLRHTETVVSYVTVTATVTDLACP
ncbi:hypothetical protein DL766_000122 [Monosporascus sp. MC13-8B]|uniref:Uncharacterized protein n=1 Tax=Monosporascus cannonballus TaxID=155416 RepID=A0ABY0H159_9PEZI|nr:hypothetical protein DL762_008193 [Monosporascus cannonballus]RYO97481.1 hypothetical protein DL763_002749 [Monosporascus cannonballus]RYP40098.1 hypothetical protein DL766_000122 [Monosporascus sp. MC13-8B]